MKVSKLVEHYRKAGYFPVGEGWRPLVEKLAQDIACIDKDVEVSQIKEKYGTLRFYIDSGNDEVYGLIEKAEQESGKICENCGTREGVTTAGGWLLTLCGRCRK